MPGKNLSKNKGGRPPRVQGERLQRINLSLRPGILFGLEVLARDRDVSISQAVEYAFNMLAKDYAIGEGTLSRIVQVVGALEDPDNDVKIELDAHDGVERTAEEKLEISSEFFETTGLARMMAMPASLLKAEEKYFLATFEVPGPGYWTEGLLFREIARKGFAEGTPPHLAAAEWRKIAKEKIAERSAAAQAKK